MDTAGLTQLILANAVEIARLYARIDETLVHRGESAQGRDEWKNACAQFHARYDELAFPGGYDSAAERILTGDPLAVEAAVCFLECRPYFFRSGYMHQQLLRRVKRAPLTPEQSRRLAFVVECQAEWRARRLAKNAA